MAEIHHKQIAEYLKQAGEGKTGPCFSPVFLIHGEEYLRKTAFKRLLAALIPDAAQNLNYENIDNADEGLAEAVQHANTYALSPGRKVVAVQDAQIFHSGRDIGKVLDLAKRAHDNGDMKKAARHVLNALALMKFTLDEVDRSGDGRKAVMDAGGGMGENTLDAILQYCRAGRMTVPERMDGQRILQEAIEKGFPGNNHLIVTTEIVDKRRALFKLIVKEGTVFDCAVPKGARKADRAAQDAVLVEKMRSVLAKAGKTADREVYQAMVGMTGFDLRTFIGNLEKLIDYVGDRKQIAVSDVGHVLKRTRKDPMYEFTNAVTDRGFDSALFYLNSLLADPDIGHPLQLLGAVINQVRKLLLIKGFMEGERGDLWYARCPYGIFQSRVMPAVQAHDRELQEQLVRWESGLAGGGGTDGKSKQAGGKRKKQPATDLVIAKNPKNAYPVYQMFKKAERFTKEELVSIIGMLDRADRRMKTSGQDGRNLLEQIVFSICRSQHAGEP